VFGGENAMNDFDEEYYFEICGRIRNLMRKLKSLCKMHCRNFKVEVDEIFSEVDKEIK